MVSYRTEQKVENAVSSVKQYIPQACLIGAGIVIGYQIGKFVGDYQAIDTIIKCCGKSDKGIAAFNLIRFGKRAETVIVKLL